MFSKPSPNRKGWIYLSLIFLLSSPLSAIAIEPPRNTPTDDTARELRQREIRKTTGRLRQLLVEISTTKHKISDLKFVATGALLIAIPKTIYNIWMFTSAKSAYLALKDVKPYTSGQLRELEGHAKIYKHTVRKSSFYGSSSAVILITSGAVLKDLEKVLSQKEIEYNAALEALATMAAD